MPFFGWNERLSNVESGKFWCPVCRRDAGYTLVESRKWFHAFFIPVMPESRPVRMVRCERCQSTFDEGVLGIVVSAGLRAMDAEADAGPGKWPEGSRVLAVWPIEQIYWYPATVKVSTKQWVEVHYDDGHKARVKASEVMAIDIKAGSKVFARFKGGPYYQPAEVTEIKGEKIRLSYDDGGTEQTNISFVRVMRGPGADMSWQYGDRVLAPWDPPFYYPGTLTEVDGDKATVEFDDGDHIDIPVALMRPLDLKEGDPIYCRWKEGPSYFPARIEEMAEEEIFVKYDDGRAERTSVRYARVIPDELPR
jgi:hypothetical protein